MPTQLLFIMLTSCSVVTGRCAFHTFLERVIMLQTI
ncbi:hypothetical protein LINPERPRIM_LOCUS28823 [Linum perenne]